MDTTELAAGVALFAVSLYVLLDGFDLGVGALLLFARDEGDRDRMVQSVAPVWDGNETWLIMAGVTLLGAFPVAYGILLPALYLPLLLMLWSLGFRGVSFEFRFQAGARWRRFWDACFCLGSVVAALCQGVILGGLVQGVAVRGQSFAGSQLDVFSPHAFACGAAVLLAYAALGAAWVAWHTDGDLAAFARRGLAATLIAASVLAPLTALAGAAVQPRVAAFLSERSLYCGLIGTAALVCAGTAFLASRRGQDARAFAGVVGLFACGLAGLVPLLWPHIVPFAVTIHEAASPTASKEVLLWGVVILMPVVLAYSAFAYWVFRGKVRLEAEA